MSDFKPHPIRLEQLVFIKSCVIAVPGHSPVEGQLTAPPHNDIQVSKIDDQPGMYSVTMKTVVNQAMDKSSPYFVDMECIAILFADDTLNEEEAKRGVTITGHSVLFGAIREAVAWLTGRQPYAPLLLGLSVLQPKQAPPAAATETK
jgi:preprotein translocase subunit SecB